MDDLTLKGLSDGSVFTEHSLGRGTPGRVSPTGIPFAAHNPASHFRVEFNGEPALVTRIAWLMEGPNYARISVEGQRVTGCDGCRADYGSDTAWVQRNIATQYKGNSMTVTSLGRGTPLTIYEMVICVKKTDVKLLPQPEPAPPTAPPAPAWVSPYAREPAYEGKESATFTASGPWIAGVCFECDGGATPTGDFVQLVGRRDDLAGAELFYEVGNNNRSMVKLSAERLDAVSGGEGDACSWLVTRSECAGCIQCDSRYCEISRTETRRIFLMKGDQELAVFVTGMDSVRPEPGFSYQFRDDRDDSSINYSDDLAPRAIGELCVNELSSSGNDNRRIDGGDETKDDVAAGNSLIAVPSIFILLAIVLKF